MAVKKPLVLGSDGRPQQLQAGDTLSVSATGSQLVQTADATLIAGNLIYSSAADHVGKAEANAGATLPCVGISTQAITSAATGTIQYGGIVTLTTAQWDAAFGTSGGLTFGTTYYLSPSTAGLGTVTCPTTTGQYVQIIGIALSSTELLFNPSDPILL
jgi:hypothetical protein